MKDYSNQRNEQPILPISRAFWFGEINNRPLAVFRILFSILLLKNAFYNLFLARWFYSDQGILPRSILFDGLVRDQRFSLMDAIGMPWMAQIFFIIWIVILFGLLVGFRTRLMVILNFIMILSIHERNGFILTGADTAMRVFSFWLMFTAAGSHYSIDSYRRSISEETENPSTFALPVRIIQLQLLIIYLVTAYLKSLEPIWKHGEALHYVLQLDSILLPPGIWLREIPDPFLTGLTYSALIAEIAIPILLFIPLRRWFIGMAFCMATLLHGGIALTLAIPDFSVMMLIAFVPHFPGDWIPRFIDTIRPYISALRHRKIIRYSVRWILRFTNRTIPSPLPYSQKILTACILIPLMGLVIWWNAVEVSRYRADYGYDALPDMPPLAKDLVWYTGLWQWWDLFAPLPIQYDGFLIIPGYFENGFSYDLRTKHPIPERETIPRFGPFVRLEKFEENIVRYQDEPILRTWAQMYCHQYNTERHAVRGTRLATLQIAYVYRDSYPPGGRVNPQQTEILWHHRCFDE